MKFISIMILFSLVMYAENISIGINASSKIIIQGSGIVLTKQFKLNNFDSIELDSSIELIVQKSLKSNYTISADDNILPLIQFTIRNNTLIITAVKSYQTNNKITVRLNTRTLKKLITESSSSIELQNLDEKNLLLDIKGAIDLKASHGRIANLTLIGDGAYDIQLLELNIQNARLSLYGSGDAQVYVRKSLNVTVSDNATLSYFGSPSIDKKIFDNGTIQKIKKGV